jgi:Eukaryotic aspartyl protease
LIDGADMGVPGFCVFGIQGGLDPSLNLFIFGDVFLRSYYSIYDFENKRIGIALHKDSKASVEEDSRTWVYIVIISSAALIVISVLVYCYCKKR